MSRKLSLILFVCLAVAQIGVPVGMIARREWTLAHGERLKLRLRPVDPYDAFRGRYVALAFDGEALAGPPGVDVRKGQRVYVLLSEEEDGFARLSSFSLERPRTGRYVAARVRYQQNGGRVRVRLPFDRYYMEEGAAPEAERAARSGLRGEGATYVTVRVLRGFGVLEELYINGVPAGELVRQKPTQ